MKQREAVYQAVMSVCDFEGKCEPTKEERAQIINIVTQGIMSGDVDFSEAAHAKYSTEPEVKKYTSGLVSNWLRKDKRLNGGVQYVPANPGSRTGSQDPEIKNLKLLIKSGRLNEEQTEKVQARIDEKVAELRASKVEQAIDLDAIPAELREQLGL